MFMEFKDILYLVVDNVAFNVEERGVLSKLDAFSFNNIGFYDTVTKTVTTNKTRSMTSKVVRPYFSEYISGENDRLLIGNIGGVYFYIPETYISKHNNICLVMTAGEYDTLKCKMRLVSDSYLLELIKKQEKEIKIIAEDALLKRQH